MPRRAEGEVFTWCGVAGSSCGVDVGCAATDEGVFVVGGCGVDESAVVAGGVLRARRRLGSGGGVIEEVVRVGVRSLASAATSFSRRGGGAGASEVPG